MPTSGASWFPAAADDLANLLRGLSLVPLRPGALAALTVASFDKRLKTLTVGKDKSGKDRKVALPDATAAFFEQQPRTNSPALPCSLAPMARHGTRTPGNTR
jgi:integrase